MRMPPLPRPVNRQFIGSATSGQWTFTYPEAALNAYGRTCREAALEEAALACESAIASIWDYHDDERKQMGTTVCNNLAAAIRRLI